MIFNKSKGGKKMTIVSAEEVIRKNPTSKENRCPECKSIMIPEGGCFICPTCGFSPCFVGE